MKKILLSLLLAGGVQNSFVMGSCGGGGAAQGGGQAAESGSRVEGRIPVVFKDGLVVYLDLQRLKALNSCLLESILFTADGLSGFGKSSEDNKLGMEEFEDLADFENFEKILKGQLSGEIADMVDFFKKADYLDINTDDHLKGLRGSDYMFAVWSDQFLVKKYRDEAQFFKLCRALLAENPGFFFSMQRVYPEILHQAIRTKNFDFAKMLIDAGADVNAMDEYGYTALICAAKDGHTEIVQLLIDAGADVNVRNNIGCTALMLVAENGQTEIAPLLIAAHADVNVRNNIGLTALMSAGIRGYTEIARLLIAANADVDARDRNGLTALMMAAMNDHTETPRLLIAANADVNVIDNNDGTALMWAAANGHTELAQLLIAAGADVNARDSDGETVLMIAVRKGHTETARLLREHGAV